MSDIRAVVGQGTSLNTANQGAFIGVRATPRGEPITQSWLQQAVFDGFVFQVQLGTEDAPIDSTTSIDDQLVWAVIDVAAGATVIPVAVEVHVATWTTATLINVMLEVDNGAVRYSSGGTAFTPLNLHTGSSNAVPSAVTAYVGTDVTVGAKTSGGSIEFARLTIGEDAVATATAQEKFFKWSALGSLAPVIEGAGSLLLHFGAASADVTGYGMIQFIAITNSLVQA